jgi:hypothetical protein
MRASPKLLLIITAVCCAENVTEEIYGVEHLDALGSHQQEWCAAPAVAPLLT